MMESITGWILQYSYAALFVLLVLGIVGIPIPDETLLTFVGYLVYRGDMHWLLSVVVAFCGSICGITISYMLGISLGYWLIHRYGYWVHITPERLDRVHAWFERYGKWTLTFGYYIPGVRHVTAYTAGMTKMRYRTFGLYAYSGALIWSCTFILLGYLLGPGWQVASQWLPAGTGMFAGAIVIVVASYAVVQIIQRRRGRRHTTPRRDGQD